MLHHSSLGLELSYALPWHYGIVASTPDWQSGDMGLSLAGVTNFLAKLGLLDATVGC